MTTTTNSFEQAPIETCLAELEDGRKIHQGWSPQCDKSAAADNEWGVLKTTSIQAGRFEPEHNKRLPEKLSPRPHLEVRPGDILLTCAGPRHRCGVSCLVRQTRGRVMISGKMYRFRANPERIRPDYLEAFLQSETARQAIDRMKTGISDSGLNLTHDRFRQLVVPLAPIAEQQGIIAEIEKQFTRLDAGVASLKQVQAALKRYRTSVLKAACEGRVASMEKKRWRNVTFGELCRVQGGYAFKSNDYQSEGTPLIRISNLVDGEVMIDSKTPRLPPTYRADYSDFLLRTGDVLIAMSGATTGKMATFMLNEPALLNQRVGRFIVKADADATREYLALVVEQIARQVLRDAYGAAQPNISPKKIEAMDLAIPPTAEQTKIVADVQRRLSIVEELYQAIAFSLRRADALRRSILQRAFNGQSKASIQTAA